MITTSESIKNMVREKYSAIALQSKETNETSCCGVGGGCGDAPSTNGTYNIMSDSYSNLAGYQPDADLGLGCGLPTEFAQIQPGDTVLDLGSGAGNDCFVARAQTGASGKVLGVDFTPAMIQRARENSERRGFNNVEFRSGDIENLPVGTDSVDVVVSNCVLNLVPDKNRVFSEILRVLHPGGHFSISDVVLVGELPPTLVQSAEMYAGCVAGAMQMDDYLEVIHQSGFENVQVQKQKPILIPDHILQEFLSAEALADFHRSKTGIFSITVFGKKPGEKLIKKAGLEKSTTQFQEIKTAQACCEPGCCN